ncbi:MAG: lipid-binding SYLF domain-containing protein [gamma proteobacterium symbiont of Bathyaustriella thionipta]|nr:lipid-binding SYLF domain-containing protein [gamma proteobacterium symbiont of Bathyaustriella thionipta]
MKIKNIMMAALLMLSMPLMAADYADTIKIFKQAGTSSHFFKSAYGYALFPTVGKAGFIIGGAHGKGRVYEKGKHIGNTSLTQASIGFQLGGEAFSEIIFFEDKRALQEFTSGNFEFGAQAQAAVITAGASANASTTGSNAGASGGKNDATTAARGYHKGMATFMILKGGLMYEASVGGQKFSYTKI